MFTGIIRHVGVVRAVRPAGSGRRPAIDLGPLAEGLRAGDSVAVAGACLTVAAINGSTAEFDVVAETLSRTTLGALRAGAKVNLERSLRVGDSLDGHFVQGHVDGLARVKAVRRGGQWVVEFAAERELTDRMVPKGSVAIDGVSLTLVEVRDGLFSVALIPTTLAETTLSRLRVGDKVNVETDVIGKYVRRCVEQFGPRAGAPGKLTVEKLKEAGFA
jgi:riboflavin synthase